MTRIFYILLGFSYFVGLYILKGGFFTPELTPILNEYIALEKIYYVSFVVVVLLILNRMIHIVFGKIEVIQKKKSLSKHILPILKKMVQVFIWILGGIMVISNLGYNVGALLTGAWIGWLALALASQKTVANMFGAVNVIINRPFEIGDEVKVGTSTGKVEDIGIIYLKIRSPEGHLIMVPNETITTATIENFSTKKK